jgi:hypothetical protein
LDLEEKWVKGDQNNDQQWDAFTEVQHMKLDIEAQLKIMCDHLASEAQNTVKAMPEVPTE